MLLVVEETLGELLAELPDTAPVTGTPRAAVLEEGLKVDVVGACGQENQSDEQLQLRPVNGADRGGLGVEARKGAPEAVARVVAAEVHHHAHLLGDAALQPRIGQGMRNDDVDRLERIGNLLLEVFGEPIRERAQVAARVEDAAHCHPFYSPAAWRGGPGADVFTREARVPCALRLRQTAAGAGLSLQRRRHSAPAASGLLLGGEDPCLQRVERDALLLDAMPGLAVTDSGSSRYTARDYRRRGGSPARRAPARHGRGFPSSDRAVRLRRDPTGSPPGAAAGRAPGTA